MFYILFLIVLFLVLANLYINYHEDARALKKVPGLTDRFLIGNTLDLLVPIEKLFGLRIKLAKRFKGIYRFYAYPIKVVCIYNPEDIEIVLSSMKFSQKSIVYDILKPWLQEGLLLSSGGSTWSTAVTYSPGHLHTSLTRSNRYKGVRCESSTIPYLWAVWSRSALEEISPRCASSTAYIMNKVYEEMQTIFGDSSRSATTDDLAEMKYLELCIKESLRLYPPVHFMGRVIQESVKLSNYTIPAGTECLIHVYDLHHREDLFKNAEVYDPDRFLPENSVGRHPYSYIPFSAGPRNCIGRKFAMMEMKSAMSAIIRNFKLEAVTKPEEVKFAGDPIMRPLKPIYVNFIQRIK